MLPVPYVNQKEAWYFLNPQSIALQYMEAVNHLSVIQNHAEDHITLRLRCHDNGHSLALARSHCRGASQFLNYSLPRWKCFSRGMQLDDSNPASE